MPGTSSLGDRRTPVRTTRRDVSSAPTLPEDDPHVRPLRRLNLFMALIHAALAVTTIAFTKNFDLRAPVFRVAIELNYTLDFSESLETLRAANASSFDDLFRVRMDPLTRGLPIAWLTLFFFILTSLAHLGAAVVYPTLYHSLLCKKCNPLRWIEYSITASLMWLILAQAFAFVDVNSLVLSTAMIAVTMASALQCEYVARPAEDDDRWTLPLLHRLAFIVPGILLYGTASLMLCVALLTGLQENLPSFVTPTILVQLGLFESFAIVLLWQQCHPPSRWIYGEYAYQWLSLLSKAVLGIVLIVNVLIYEEYACVFDDASC